MQYGECTRFLLDALKFSALLVVMLFAVLAMALVSVCRQIFYATWPR